MLKKHIKEYLLELGIPTLVLICLTYLLFSGFVARAISLLYDEANLTEGIALWVLILVLFYKVVLKECLKGTEKNKQVAEDAEV